MFADPISSLHRPADDRSSFRHDGPEQLGAYGATIGMIGAAGLPLPPLAFAAAVAIELGGGLHSGRRLSPRTVAAALALFSLATQSRSTATRRPDQMIHFLKKRDDGGGLLQIAAFGGGALSMDNRASLLARCSSPASAV